MEIINNFRDYLLGKKISNPTTLKNYLSDIRHFISWYAKSFGAPFSTEEFSDELIKLYEGTSGASLSAGGTVNHSEKMSHASIKRRLSSLRQFARFAVESGSIEENPFELITTHKSQITNLDHWHITEFKDYLKFKKASELTVKNYVTDIHSFRRWYEQAIEPQVGSLSFPVINDGIIEEYKNRLIEHKASAPRTINRKLSSIRKFVEFAIASNLVTKDYFYTPSGVDNLAVTPEETSSQATLSLSDLEDQKVKLKYSPFPPIRLFQVLLVLPYLLLEGFIAEKLIILLYGSKPLTIAASKLSSLSGIKMPQKPSDLLKVKGYEKNFYAPNEISLDTYPLHRRLWHHARHTRPAWYKKYHNLPIVHYIHFALLIIFATGAGVALYRTFVTDVKSPLFAAPLSPPRILSFQGRLTDNLNNPITTATDIRFAVYNNISSSGSALLWQEVHYSTIPDQDGIFSVLLGTNTAIPDSVFFENTDTFLGVTIQSTPELTPRRRIASVPYAANSESLQGMLPITDGGAGTVNVVLALDSSGDLTIGGSATPTFTATGGQFELSGSVLLLSTNTGTNSNVIIAPDGLGTIDLRKPLTNKSATGNLTPGGVEINDKFGVLATESAVAAFILRNDGAGDLFTASTSSTTRFTIENDGTLIIPAYNTAGGIFYANGSGVINQTTAGGSGDCLQSAGGLTPTWGTCGSGGLWRIDQGAISPINDTLDFLVGSNATASAKFAILNVNSGNPTASLSGNLSLVAPTGANPATLFNILNGGSLNIGTSIGGDTGLTSRLFVANNGNMGIGSASPTEKVTIQNNLVGNHLGIYDGANSTNLLLADAGVLTLKPTGFDTVYTFDGTSTYTNNTTESKTNAGTAYTILSVENPSNDIFYVGLDHPFSIVNFDIAQAGGGVTLVRQYFNGSWTSLTSTDNTSNLTVDGTVTFTAPGDWTTTSVNGTTKYWVRFSSSTQVTTAPTAQFTTPTTGNRFYAYAQSGDANPALYISDKGGLGVRTTSPLAGFDIRGIDGTTTIASISGNTNQPALLVDNAVGAGNQIVASKSGQTVFVVDNDGNIIVGKDGGGKITAAIIDPYLVQNQYTTGNTQLTFQTMAASNGDFIFKNQTTTLATLVQAGQLQLAITGSSGGLSIGADTLLFRGDTNRLDLASGDSFNVVSGNYQVGGVTIIDSSSNATFNDITVNGTCSGCSSGTGGAFDVLSTGVTVQKNQSTDLLIGASATTSAKFAVLNVNSGTPVASISAISPTTALALSSSGSIQTVRNNTLTLGGDTTGNIVISPLNGAAGSALTVNTITTNLTGTTTLNATSLGTINSATTLGISGTTLNLGNGSAASLATTSNQNLTVSAGSGILNLNTVDNGAVTTGTGLTTLGGSLTIDGVTTTFANAAPVITTGTDTNLTITPNGSGNLILTSDFNTGVKIGSSSNPLAPLSVIGGIGSNASFIVNQLNSGDIIAASSSGTTRLTIDNTGNLQLFGQADLRFADADSSNYVAFQAPATVGTNVTWTLPNADASGCFQSNGAGALSISTCGSGGDSFWSQNLGLLYPGNTTMDLAIGGTSSTSAKFVFQNVNSGQPTFKAFDSASAQSINIFHDGTDGNITASTGTINIGNGGGTLYLETDIKNDTANFDGAIKISDKLLVTNTESAGTALAVFNNLGAGDIFTASNSGAPRFSITSAGGIKLGTSEGTGGECLKSGGAGLASSWGACASQTPWTSDIDADGFDLTDLSNIEFRTTTGAPAGSIVAGYSDNTGDLTFNVLTGKTFNLAVNGTDEYNFSSIALEMNGNNITGIGNITATAGLAINTTTTGILSLDSGTTGAINIGTNANAKTLTLGNTTTTTALNFDTGTGGINFGDNANTKTIDIGGVTNSGTDTINIATEGTAADVISIGNANAATTVAITGGNDWSITAGGALTVASCTGCGGVTGTNSPFQQGAGIIFPNNSTVDFLIGGQATASAKFAVTGIDSGTPTASVSATAVTDRPGLYMTGTGILSSVNKGTLTIGSANTGNIVIGTDATDRIITLGNVTGATALTLNSGTGAINIGTSIAKTITLGNTTTSTSLALNSGTGGIALASTSTGDITLNSSDTLLLDSAGVLELNSSAGIISIGNDAIAQAINLGTGAAARTITLGNITGATAVNLNTGTGGSTITTTGAGDFTVASGDDVIINGAGANAAIDIGTAAVAHTIGIGNVTGATALTLNSGTGAINIGTSIAKTLTIGNATTTTALNFDTGTGGINFGDNANTKTIDIGGVTNSGTDTINIATEGTAADVISIGNANAATTVAITGGNDWSITAGGALTVASCTGCGGGGGGAFDVLSTGVTVQQNQSTDLLIGASATTSAKFAVTGIDSGTPTASVSATAVTDRPGLYMTGTGILSSVNKGTLTVGSSNTGNIVIGTDATDRIITLGNNTGASAVNINTGTGGLAIASAGTQRFVVGSDGRIGIGTIGAPANNGLSPRFRVYNDLSHTDPAASISAKTTSASLVITQDGNGDLLTASVSGGTTFAVRNNGDIFFTGTTIGPGADFAEYYKKENPSEVFEAGMLVCQTKNAGVTRCDNDDPNHILLGAISDNPLITGGGDKKNDTNYVLVGLIGQLRVRVGGNIEVGDPLTISPTTGIAVKATSESTVIGYAMESNQNGSKQRVSSSIQKSYYNPNMILNYSGDTPENFMASLNINEQNGKWRLTDAFGNIVNRTSAFSNLVVANIKAGFVNAQKIATNTFTASTATISNLTAGVINGTSATIANVSVTSLNASSAVLGNVSITSENVLVAGVSLRDYIAGIVEETLNSQFSTFNSDAIISPIASINEINTNIISPLGENGAIEIQVEPESIAINNTDTGEKVVEIDNEGNARFAGDLEARRATFSGTLSSETLETNDATISGTLTADRIIANTIDGLDDRISSIASQLVASNTQQVASESSSPTTNYQLPSTIDELEVGNLYADFGIYSEGLSVLGSITTAQLTAMDSIAIGTGFIMTDNSINTLGATLEIQPLRQGDISFMAGRVKIDTDGNMDINGNLNLAGIINAPEGVFDGISTNSIATNIISPLGGSDLTIKLGDTASNSGSLIVANQQGQEKLRISDEGNLTASGSGTFDKLNFNLVGEALADSDLTATATGSAGFATVQRNRPEVTIYNERITKDSLIYITPFGNTQNKVLHLLRQVPQSETADGSFTVGISGIPATIDIQFNWLIVN